MIIKDQASKTDRLFELSEQNAAPFWRQVADETDMPAGSCPLARSIIINVKYWLSAQVGSLRSKRATIYCLWAN